MKACFVVATIAVLAAFAGPTCAQQVQGAGSEIAFTSATWTS